MNNLLSRILKKLGFKGENILFKVEQVKCEITRSYLIDKILNSTKMGVNVEEYCDREVIVSLTTYGKRVWDVALTIESIMQQTLLPNRIILNLDENLRSIPLPRMIEAQVIRGLEIKYVKDIKSYTKLIPTLRENPESIIITIDDDVLYECDVIERLVDSYKENPNDVSALRTHYIQFYNNGTVKPYNKWIYTSTLPCSSYRNFQTGVGGVLYPPHVLHSEVMHEEIFMDICPTADDVWFHAMTVLNGRKIVKVAARHPNGDNYMLNDNVQDIGLFHINTGQNGANDRQIKAVYEKYGLLEKLSADADD